MAIKKSELYSSLWKACDELRGGMDASQYKDYVLVMLFIKYVSDKYKDNPYGAIQVPEGATFDDMISFKGNKDIGDLINKRIIAPLKEANRLSDMPNFNDPSKLGDGQEMVDLLTKLISIFENPELDFSKNRAEGDDILGDAYEYLMRHFASESGKSKGQFYTPAEVSRVLAKIIGVNAETTRPDTTVYDPTCGSGSLLIKVGAEAEKQISLYGQEKDNATAGLAKMNMILHNNATAVIEQGNTISNPYFIKDGKRFDFVVANPPFSSKSWNNGINPEKDIYDRFKGYGIPPEKNGDYAFLLHIIASLKSKGKGACILPHGVLFRGNAEEEIRKNIIKKGYIKGIIGLPANLFYGTGIPACIIVLDKENTETRKGIFMVDASKGFVKDGNKNRLREQDIHKIVDVFNNNRDEEKYARFVTFEEIEKNDYNLNIPRYIDSSEPEDIQDMTAHLSGGIPNRDIDALSHYWAVCPSLKSTLFEPNIKDGYSNLKNSASEVRSLINESEEFTAFKTSFVQTLNEWVNYSKSKIDKVDIGFNPKILINDISENVLIRFKPLPLIHSYDVYQQTMNYWAETMQDDCYLIAENGWKAIVYRITEINKKGKEVDKGWACDLLPKQLVAEHYFKTEVAKINGYTEQVETTVQKISELEEEHSGPDGLFSELEKVNATEAKKRLKAIKGDNDCAEEARMLKEYINLKELESEIKKQLKAIETALDDALYQLYPALTTEQVKVLVLQKWFGVLQDAFNSELSKVLTLFAARVTELAERYEHTLAQIEAELLALEAKVNEHLKTMGLQCKVGAMQALLKPKDGWICKQLKEVADIFRGGSPRPIEKFLTTNEDGINWIKIGDVDVNAKYIKRTEEKIIPEGISRSRFVNVGDFLLSNSMSFGRPYILKTSGCIHDGWLVIQNYHKSFDTDFLYYMLGHDSIMKQYKSMASGSSVLNLNKEIVNNVFITYPDISEQIRLATILSDMDKEIELLEKKLAKQKMLKAGAIQELLTGRTRLVNF